MIEALENVQKSDEEDISMNKPSPTGDYRRRNICRCRHGGRRCLAVAYGDGVTLCYRCDTRRGACTCRCRSCDPRGPRHTEQAVTIDAHIEAPIARTAGKEGHRVGVRNLSMGWDVRREDHQTHYRQDLANRRTFGVRLAVPEAAWSPLSNLADGSDTRRRRQEAAAVVRCAVRVAPAQTEEGRHPSARWAHAMADSAPGGPLAACDCPGCLNHIRRGKSPTQAGALCVECRRGRRRWAPLGLCLCTCDGCQWHNAAAATQPNQVPELAALMSEKGYKTVRFDKCRFGLQTSPAEETASALGDRQCSGEHSSAAGASRRLLAVGRQQAELGKLESCGVRDYVGHPAPVADADGGGETGELV